MLERRSPPSEKGSGSQRYRALSAMPIRSLNACLVPTFTCTGLSGSSHKAKRVRLSAYGFSRSSYMEGSRRTGSVSPVNDRRANRSNGLVETGVASIALVNVLKFGVTATAGIGCAAWHFERQQIGCILLKKSPHSRRPIVPERTTAFRVVVLKPERHLLGRIAVMSANCPVAQVPNNRGPPVAQNPTSTHTP